MPLVSMRQLLDHAAEHQYGLPAFNVNNMEQIQSIMEAAKETNSPVIIQGPNLGPPWALDLVLFFPWPSGRRRLSAPPAWAASHRRQQWHNRLASYFSPSLTKAP